MSFGERKCQGCGRSHYKTPQGEVKPLEVCYSNLHRLWLCRRCYMEKPA